jgi:hypothetical protein
LLGLAAGKVVVDNLGVPLILRRRQEVAIDDFPFAEKNLFTPTILIADGKTNGDVIYRRIRLWIKVTQVTQTQKPGQRLASHWFNKVMMNKSTQVGVEKIFE